MVGRIFTVVPRFFATVVAVCMVMTPVCSARCAAQACATPSAGERTGGCHQSPGDTESPGMKGQPTSVSCRAGEVVFAVLRPDELSPAKKSSSRDAASQPTLKGAFNDGDGAAFALSVRIVPSPQITPIPVSPAPLRL